MAGVLAIACWQMIKKNKESEKQKSVLKWKLTPETGFCLRLERSTQNIPHILCPDS